MTGLKGIGRTPGDKRVRRNFDRLMHKLELMLGDGLVVGKDGKMAVDPDMNRLIWITALAQAEGNLTLADATNWGVEKASIRLIRVVTTSEDWDLTLYPDGDFDEAGYAPSLPLVRRGYKVANIARLIPWRDGDETANVYLKFTDNDGAATADIYISGMALR